MNKLMRGARFLLYRLCRHLLFGWVDSFAWRAMEVASTRMSQAAIVGLLVLPFAVPTQGSQVQGAIEEQGIRAVSHKTKKSENRVVGSDQLACLAQNIAHEAGGELLVGQVAVAHVTLNRVTSRKYPSDICDVVRQGGSALNRCQFSWYCDGKPDLSVKEIQEKHRESWGIAQDILNGTRWQDDPTEGATHFYSAVLHEPPGKRPPSLRKLKPPAWRLTMTSVGRIGDHLFFKVPTAGKGPVEERFASQ
jgi:spore germination cell wall hydrolase CwlJ-like protein